MREGWELVRADEYPESDYPTMTTGKYAGVIGVGGLLLARIPEEIALQIDAYYKKQTKQRRSSRERSYEGTAPKYANSIRNLILV